MNVSIVVFAGPHEPSIALDGICNHVVNETVFIPKFLRLKVFLVLGVIDVLEDVLEATIIALEDGVLCAQVERVVT